MALLEFTIRLDWRNLISTWLLWPVTDRITAPLNPVAWSLCFEVLFYAAFSVILWRRWSAAPILALFVFAMALRSIAPVFAYLGNPLILEFLAGVALAYARPWRAAVWALPLGCALFLFFVILGVSPSIGSTRIIWPDAMGLSAPSPSAFQAFSSCGELSSSKRKSGC